MKRARDGKKGMRGYRNIITAALGASLCIACGHSSDGARTGCIADSVGALHLLSSVPSCKACDWACHLKCRAGDERSCLALGYAANSEPRTEEEARGFY